MATRNTVLAPLVLVQNEAGATEYFYRGAVLPSFVKGDDLKRLVDEGMVGSQDDLAAAAVPSTDGTQPEPKKAPAKSS